MYFILALCTYHSFLFFFHNTATTELYTLSLHDALPISSARSPACNWRYRLLWSISSPLPVRALKLAGGNIRARSEEHTSELQSQSNLVCRLLLEKKKRKRQ